MSASHLSSREYPHQSEQGLTAIELAVVVAILSIMASLVAANTTGMSFAARGSVKMVEIAEVQKATDSFVGIEPNASYPVSRTLVVDASGTPVPGKTLGRNNLPPAPYYAVVDFDKHFTTPEGATLYFVPQFLRRLPKHALDQPTAWLIDSSGTVTNTLPADTY